MAWYSNMDFACPCVLTMAPCLSSVNLTPRSWPAGAQRCSANDSINGFEAPAQRRGHKLCQSTLSKSIILSQDDPILQDASYLLGMTCHIANHLALCSANGITQFARHLEKDDKALQSGTYEALDTLPCPCMQESTADRCTMQGNVDTRSAMAQSHALLPSVITGTLIL